MLNAESGNQGESQRFWESQCQHTPLLLSFLSSMASSLSEPWIPLFVHMGKMLPQPTVTFGILNHCFGSAQRHTKDAKHQKILWMLSLAYMFPRNNF